MIRFFINYKGMLSLNVKDRREVILWKIQKRPDTGAYWSDAEKVISPISG